MHLKFCITAESLNPAAIKVKSNWSFSMDGHVTRSKLGWQLLHFLLHIYIDFTFVVPILNVDHVNNLPRFGMTCVVLYMNIRYLEYRSIIARHPNLIKYYKLNCSTKITQLILNNCAKKTLIFFILNIHHLPRKWKHSGFFTIRDSVRSSRYELPFSATVNKYLLKYKHSWKGQSPEITFTCKKLICHNS